ncbi:hypothetical protein [Actinomadura sp. NBRC 104412]|uniref:hypothetical protein n=1 Tax=Actinomadura sp. NBRC 104412 TaxID=3032203 RepID=UPI0025553B5C|nr:hypothetical protein [Actinomadura sp. NBRC 104412]
MTALEDRHRKRFAAASEQPAPRTVNFPWGMTVLCAVVAAFFAALALITANVERGLARGGVETGGVVVRGYTSNKTKYWDVAFTTPDGRRHVASIKSDHWHDEPDGVGSRVRIEYPESDPGGIVEQAGRTTADRVAVPVICSIASVIFLLCAYGTRPTKPRASRH